VSRQKIQALPLIAPQCTQNSNRTGPAAEQELQERVGRNREVGTVPRLNHQDQFSRDHQFLQVNEWARFHCKNGKPRFDGYSLAGLIRLASDASRLGLSPRARARAGARARARAGVGASGGGLAGVLGGFRLAVNGG
jgi:hypothetical protein